MVVAAETKKLRDSRVLVTGAAGFIGRHLAQRLLREGADVVGVSRVSRDQDPDTILRRVSWVQADLSDPTAAQRVIDDVRPDVVFHLASYVAGARDRAVVRPMLAANTYSTVGLLDAAAAQRCRFVQVGSIEEPDGTAEFPCSPYAASKAAASIYAMLYAAHYELNVSVARVAMVYGPGEQDPNKLIAYLLRNARGAAASGSLRLSSGTRGVDWVYVSDVVAGLVRLAETPELAGRHVDFGSGQLVSVRDVVCKLWRLMELSGAPPFGTVADRQREPECAADAERTDSLIGWRATTGLDAGLQQTVEWFREHH